MRFLRNLAAIALLAIALTFAIAFAHDTYLLVNQRPHGFVGILQVVGDVALFWSLLSIGLIANAVRPFSQK